MRRLHNVPLFVILIAIGGLAMYLPAAHALALRQYAVSRPFFYFGTLMLALSALLALATAANRPGNASRNQLLTMVATFTVLPLMLAVPFREAVANTTLFNAWWEMVSSLTTTGATLYDPARLAPSLHLWRALVGWMGGFYILVMAIAVLAPLRLGGFEVLSSAPASASTLPGVGNDNAGFEHATASQMRVLRNAVTIAPIYGGLTLALWVGLLIAGDPALVALCHAMSTLATSGITPLGNLGQAPSGSAGEALIFLFLIPALSRRFWPGGQEMRASTHWSRDPELLLAAGLVLTVPLILFLRHWIASFDYPQVVATSKLATAIWGGLFTVLSFLTTTGFESLEWSDARSWSGLGTPGLVLAGLAITGGGVATTAGGVKLLRVYALMRQGTRELERLVHPSSVGGGGIVARRLRRDGALVAWIFFMLFAISIAVVMFAVSLAGVGFEAATILSVAALSNTGPLAAISGLGTQAWAVLSPEAKTVLAAAMTLGRLETLAIIALFNPEFWRR